MQKKEDKKPGRGQIIYLFLQILLILYMRFCVSSEVAALFPVM